MFTGIIEATGKILEKTESTLSVERPVLFDDIMIGSSIAVAGVCLSIVRLDDTSMSFDVVQETLAKTNLGMKKVGDRLNLERALAASGRFDGHIVQGHVEATGTVQNAGPLLTVDIPNELRHFIIAKGSIAIDGVSLTVVSMEHTLCTIACIPHTMEKTTLGSLQPGDIVNIETDILGRYVLSQQS